MIFKNEYDYLKKTRRLPLLQYIYRRTWKNNYTRIKVTVYINRLKNRIHDFISQS